MENDGVNKKLICKKHCETNLNFMTLNYTLLFINYIEYRYFDMVIWLQILRISYRLINVAAINLHPIEIILNIQSIHVVFMAWK